MYENNATNTLKGGSIKMKPVRIPNVSTGTTKTNGVVNSRSIKPASPMGMNGGIPNVGDGMRNPLPPVPVADKINTGMRHTALSADGKSKVSAMKHLPKATALPGLAGLIPGANTGPFGGGSGPAGM